MSREWLCFDALEAHDEQRPPAVRAATLEFAQQQKELVSMVKDFPQNQKRLERKLENKDQ
jgi:hypothetical protein